MEPITLRGHHLLCVHGFRGMGYSPAFVAKMSEVVEKIRDVGQDFSIRVVQGLDDTCQFCPNKGENRCEASSDSEAHVQQLDQNVIQQLGIAAGEVYLKSELIRWTKERVHPDDLARLCEGCSWYSYGVCQEGIAALREGTT
ncbi:DUF1284 domain-containing protein [Brevibacillus composti]|uniref:DUF1284 domain-containing protein n=1 Tax=Brevibacillus composti TaxID=2796470 RepID=A0A7T5JPZ9_9BACL|nr:DUF1284 domain-containing protein [Brevibacillus composti]QQE75824.1 DUF1284 domain-containing protein [Brevibacillus composti]QUO42850.1 DUF1284 domain-containing protein [Brevibacillus composti]